MSHKMIAKILGVAFSLSPAPAFWADAAARDSQLLPHFDNMRYFILDASKQAEGSRSITYINLIGDFDAKSFKVYYNGSATGLARTACSATPPSNPDALRQCCRDDRHSRPHHGSWQHCSP